MAWDICLLSVYSTQPVYIQMLERRRVHNFFFFFINLKVSKSPTVSLSLKNDACYSQNTVQYIYWLYGSVCGISGIINWKKVAWICGSPDRTVVCLDVLILVSIGINVVRQDFFLIIYYLYVKTIGCLFVGYIVSTQFTIRINKTIDFFYPKYWPNGIYRTNIFIRNWSSSSKIIEF